MRKNIQCWAESAIQLQPPLVNFCTTFVNFNGTLKTLLLFVWQIPLFLPCGCYFPFSLSLPKKINKQKDTMGLITSTWQRPQAAISARYFFFGCDFSLLLLYFPKQWMICLSHQPWTEYCRALQFHALTTDKSFCLAGHESSRAERPHSVALLHLMLEKLHPLNLGMHLHCLEIRFNLYATKGTIREN